MITKDLFNALPLEEVRKLVEGHPDVAYVNIIDWNDVNDMCDPDGNQTEDGADYVY